MPPTRPRWPDVLPQVVLLDDQLRRSLLLAFTEDDRLHFEEVARLLRLLQVMLCRGESPTPTPPPPAAASQAAAYCCRPGHCLHFEEVARLLRVDCCR